MNADAPLDSLIGWNAVDTVTDPAAELAHTVDRYEKIVTADLRMMQTQRELLRDARVALADGRTAVVDEFIERTIDAISKRIDAIRGR